MELKYLLALTIGSTLFAIAVIVFLIICCCRKKPEVHVADDIEAGVELKEKEGILMEDFVRFNGAEDLTLFDILEAPGEVIGKSGHGTLYRANLQRTVYNSIALLRFLRPGCTLRIKEVMPIIELLGCLRHPNLVPLYAFYSGPKGEKLMVHPFYRLSNLAQLIRDGNREFHRWTVIYRISIGIAKALNYLHTGIEKKPIIHGNLKSNNILLNRQCQPYVSDFSLHLLLTPIAGQKMLEASSMEGYKAPELLKIKDSVEKSDIYSYGVILLELLTGKKEPIDDPNAVKTAIVDDKISELYHPEIVLDECFDRRAVIEDRIFKLFQLSMACCSTSPSLRPDATQILTKLQEIGR